MPDVDTQKVAKPRWAGSAASTFLPRSTPRGRGGNKTLNSLQLFAEGLALLIRKHLGGKRVGGSYLAYIN